MASTGSGSDTHARVEAFIKRWHASGAAERANAQSFLAELCDLLDVPIPDPASPDDHENAYIFERRVLFENGDGSTTPNWIDLYKRGCFVLEAKQGADKTDPGVALSTAEQKRRAQRHKGTATRDTAAWERAMMKARGQAENYVHALPASEGRPPFVIVVDVGHCIELYSEFTCTGGNYVPFPDPRSHRILLDDLREEDVRARLCLLWTNPMALDPSRRTAKVTRDIADRLAKLAQSLEASEHRPKSVAGFLMRCLFTMFAEDVGLLPDRAFTELLQELRAKPDLFKAAIEDLWRIMNTGGYYSKFMAKLLRFNGGLFAEPHALDVTEDQLELLIEAARADWREVEPAIFGTLLERALAPEERHKLGAHYTPRAYVDRLVVPTIVEPLREEWAATQAAAFTLAAQGKNKESITEIHRFHQRLCAVRVLDPACGSGNFLYVTLEHLKRLEGEVFNTLSDLGEKQTLIESEGVTVDPHQLLGIEINPRAAAITELVLWIGYLQWHFRTHGDITPPEPVIKNFHNIECRDAILAYEHERIVVDPDTNQPVTRWDGQTYKQHPVTGKDVPDEAARANVYEYTNPRPAEWPEADFVVGNPPFIGTALMRQALGDGYTETLRKAIAEVPESSDYVMYWWNHAAHLARQGDLRRFGFIATNSLRQTFNRRVLERHMNDKKKPLSIRFAVPDHPWVDAADGADVRISMSVAEAGAHEGTLKRVTRETAGNGDVILVEFDTTEGVLHSDLTVGVDIASAVPQQANCELSCRGVQLIGSGFIVTPEEAKTLGLGRLEGLERHIRQYRNGRDLTQTPRGVMVIDLFGLESEEVRTRYPEVYQWVYERVKPERDHNKRASYRDSWWIHGEPRRQFRPALQDLPRYIATVETAKHRFFVFLDENILPDNKLVSVALDDAHILGILSSRIHGTWALAAGSHLGVGNDPVYVKTRCFEAFPFPEASDAQKARIRELGEALDGHRKRQQAEHPALTMTGMYNVLAKLRSGEVLTKKEQAIHEQGLVSVLKELHDDLDAAVFDAYGWPSALDDEGILERLVALNAQRAAEERQGTIRWLRPEYQCPEGPATQTEAVEAVAAAAVEAQTPKKRPWPKALAEQAQTVRTALAAFNGPATAEQVARTFKSARTKRVGELLDTLASLGQCRIMDDDRYVG